jgi:hypothetical protein
MFPLRGALIKCRERRPSMTTKAHSILAGAMLLEKLGSDKRLAAKIEGAKNYSDFLGLALTEGFDLSGLSEQEAIALAKGDRGALGEISEAELAQIAGGMLSNAMWSPNNPPPSSSPPPPSGPTWGQIGW